MTTWNYPLRHNDDFIHVADNGGHSCVIYAPHGDQDAIDTFRRITDLLEREQRQNDEAKYGGMADAFVAAKLIGCLVPRATVIAHAKTVMQYLAQPEADDPDPGHD